MRFDSSLIFFNYFWIAVNNEKREFQKTWNTHLPDPIYATKLIGNETYRVYDLRMNSLPFYDATSVFVSEIAIFHKYMTDIEKIVLYVECEANHNIIFDKVDLNVFLPNVKDTNLTPKWLEIRKLQSDDLSYLFKECFFQSALLLSHISNNKYYFNMVLSFNNDFDVNKLQFLNFKTIKIKKITRIYNITHQFFKNVLNFDELYSYFFKEVKTPEWNNIFTEIMSGEKLKETDEYTNLENYKNYQLKYFSKDMFDLNNENDFLYNLYDNLFIHKSFEKKYKNYDVYLENCFSQLGWIWVVLDNEWKDIRDDFGNTKYTYPMNEGFLAIGTIDSQPSFEDIRLDFKELVDKYSAESFDSWCMLDCIRYSLVDSDYPYNIQQYTISTCITNFGTEFKIYYDLNIKNKK